MNNTTPRLSSDERQAQAEKLTLVQHNSQGSWDVFLSSFNSFVGIAPVDIVLLQDPPVCRGITPSFTCFKSFAPPVSKPPVACYVCINFCKKYPILHVFFLDVDDVMFIDGFTPEGCFVSLAPRFRIGNIYYRALDRPSPSHTVSPDTTLESLHIPYLLTGYFNIHN